jgi:hypothetical protein
MFISISVKCNAVNCMNVPTINSATVSVLYANYLSELTIEKVPISKLKSINISSYGIKFILRNTQQLP